MSVCNYSAIVIDVVRGHESAPHIGLPERQGQRCSPAGRCRRKLDATAAAVDRRDSARLEGKAQVLGLSGWKVAP